MKKNKIKWKWFLLSI